MKRLPVIIGVTFTLCIYSLISCGYIYGKTLYYSPVVNYSGDKIAYVKRLVNYSAWGGSIIPFMGKQAKVKVRSDRIQLCEKNLESGKEIVIEDWKMPILKKDKLGYVKAILNWDLEQLRYTIKLSGYGKINVGKFHHPYWTLTNTKNGYRLKNGPSVAGGVKVNVSSDPGVRYPGSNKLVVEKTWDEEIELPKIKKEMALKIEQDLNELNSALSDPERTKGGEVKKVKAEIDKEKRLSDFIDKQKLGRLPEKLTKLFLEESAKPSGKYPDLKPYVIMLGEAGVKPLMNNFDQASADSRQHILSALGGIGSSSSLALIRREIQSENLEIQKEAITALGMVKTDRAKEELDMILADADMAPVARKTVLLQLKQINAAKWHSTVLRTVLKDEILFEQLPSIVSDLNAFPIMDVWSQLPPILEILQGNNQQACQIAQQLVLTFDERMFLIDVYPILDDLLKTCFDYGKTVNASGEFVKDKSMQSADTCLWDRNMASTLLERIEKNLDKHDFVNWFSNATRKPKSLLDQLYVEHMYIEKGGQVINRPPVKFLIEVVVKDSKGRLFSSARHVMQLEKPVILQGKSFVSEYPAHTYEGRIMLDQNAWRLKMDSFHIHQKPQGVSFPVEIPFGGAYERIVNEQFKGKSESFLWTIKHIDEPKMKM